MMIYTDTAIQNINKLDYHKETQTHFIVRCPYCGDSNNNLNHGHLYLAFDKPVFHCVRCNASGTIQSLFLKLFNIDFNVSDLIRSEFIEMLSISNKIVYDKNIFNKEFSRNLESMGAKYDRTINYIASRLNRDIPPFLNERIIDDIELKKYYLIKSKFVNNEYMKKLIVDDYVGFMSDRKTYINFRSMNPDNKYKYIKVKIEDTNVTDFFTIFNSEYEYDDIPTITFAEGIFDILSSYFYTRKYNNSLLYISCNKNFFNVPYYIKIMYSIYYANYCYLADSSKDINIEYIKKKFFMYNENKDCVDKLTCMKNMNGKDFGDIRYEHNNIIEFF